MKLFVTGGTGFLGSHFLRQAFMQGHELLALRRPGSTARIELTSEPEWLSGNLDDDWSYRLKGCDALVHIAAQGVSPQKTDWNQAMDVNVRASLNLLQQAELAGVPRILTCGSCFEFGRSGERYEEIPPDALMEPVGPYSASKAAFTLAATAFARTSDASLVILRPFHFYGEGQDPANFWPALKAAAEAGADFSMTAGDQIRDYQPVEEVADFFLQTLENWPGVRGSLHLANVGSGNPVTLRNFAEHWWEVWQAKGELRIGEIPYRSGEVMRFVPAL